MSEEKKKLRKFLDEGMSQEFEILYAKDDASVPKEIPILINKCMQFNYEDRPFVWLINQELE